MTVHDQQLDELRDLLEALCEQRLDRKQCARLEQLVLADPAARKLYFDYIELHGSLYWDAAMSDAALNVDDDRGDGDRNGSIIATPDSSPIATSARPLTEQVPSAARRNRRFRTAAIAAGLLLLAGFAAWSGYDRFSEPETSLVVRPPNPVPVEPTTENPKNGRATDAHLVERREQASAPDQSSRNRPGAILAPQPPAVIAAHEAPTTVPKEGSSQEVIVAFVDRELESHWKASEIAPSPIADDSEWVRRAYLDIVGHIPPVEEAKRFLADDRPEKRAILIESLLDRPDYVRHASTIWANLLVGRASDRETEREALERFLRRGFAENRPWSEMVGEMVAAEGTPEENGAAGFLVAHLESEAVPATAITARLFLGTRVQCTQCHDHPFNDSDQREFWELNSFFQQTALVASPEGDSRKLVTRDVPGPLYFESRQGVMRIAFPRFEGIAVDPGAETDRRAELAKLMARGEKTRLAEAYVNRLWARFFGYGFTNPVDDMGPHNAATHPELLDRLTREFVASGYDTKELIRWICNSRAYQLTSRMGASNGEDAPERGNPPLFSRMYARPMTPEQVYDSLVIATSPRREGGPDWKQAQERRRAWLRQFVYTYDTEENDESSTFEGTVSQALMLMNGDLTATAISGERGTFLHEVLAEPTSEREKIRTLCLASLSRNPTPQEMTTLRRLVRSGTGKNNRRTVSAAGMQDLFWALLNSSEFAHVH